MTRHLPLHPSGRPWRRSFTTAEAAWRAIVVGCNSRPEWDRRRDDMMQAGWRVMLVESPAAAELVEWRAILTPIVRDFIEDAIRAAPGPGA